MNKAYIWDLDGTLLDSYQTIVYGVYETYREHGILLDKEELHSYIIRYSVRAYIAFLQKTTGLTEEIILPRYAEITDAQKKNIPLIPHAKEILTALRERGNAHYVFTHRGESSIFILKNLGIYDLFEEIITAKHPFPRKPSPDALLYLTEKHRLSRENTYYVGDRTIDMDCAKNAHVRGILYLPQDSYCTPNGSETYIVRDLSEILRLDDENAGDIG